MWVGQLLSADIPVALDCFLLPGQNLWMFMAFLLQIAGPAAGGECQVSGIPGPTGFSSPGQYILFAVPFHYRQ